MSAITGVDVIYSRGTEPKPGFCKIPVDLNKALVESTCTSVTPPPRTDHQLTSFRCSLEVLKISVSRTVMKGYLTTSTRGPVVNTSMSATPGTNL